MSIGACNDLHHSVASLVLEQRLNQHSRNLQKGHIHLQSAIPVLELVTVPSACYLYVLLDKGVP